MPRVANGQYFKLYSLVAVVGSSDSAFACPSTVSHNCFDPIACLYEII